MWDLCFLYINFVSFYNVSTILTFLILSTCLLFITVPWLICKSSLFFFSFSTWESQIRQGRTQRSCLTYSFLKRFRRFRRGIARLQERKPLNSSTHLATHTHTYAQAHCIKINKMIHTCRWRKNKRNKWPPNLSLIYYMVKEDNVLQANSWIHSKACLLL